MGNYNQNQFWNIWYTCFPESEPSNQFEVGSGSTMVSFWTWPVCIPRGEASQNFGTPPRGSTTDQSGPIIILEKKSIFSLEFYTYDFDNDKLLDGIYIFIRNNYLH